MEGRRLLSAGTNLDIGTNNAMTAAPDGTLYVAYFRQTSATTGDLRYAIRNADGTWRAPGADGGIIDDSSAFVGASVSIALDGTGKPGVAYTDSTNADLRYAHFNGTTWDDGMVYTSTGKRGNYPALAYQNNKPTISSFVKTTTGGFLVVNQNASLNPSTPSSWTETTVDNSGDAGRYSTIVFNPNTSKWGIAYTDTDAVTRGPRYVESSGSSVTTGWGTPAVVPQPSSYATTSQAWWSSLLYDSSNRPAFAWYNDNECDVVFSHRNGAGNTWASGTVDSKLITGRNPNLRINAAGKFSVAYFDQHVSALEVKDGGDTGGGWSAATVAGSGTFNDLRLVHSNLTGVDTYSYSDETGVHVSDDQEGVAWTKESGATAFGGRYDHTSVVFDNHDAAARGPEMWVMGGLRGSVLRNDVWASNDGLGWRQLAANGNTTAFTARRGAASVVFDDQSATTPGEKMWVLGGMTGTTTASTVGDVWWSQDGANWTKVQSGGVDADFGARVGHSAVVLNGQMFVIGGRLGGAVPANPVVRSADGATWTPVTDANAVAAGGLLDPAVLTYNGKIYVIGAENSSTFDTYVSDSTGTSWLKAGVPNVNLTGGAGTVYDGKMWVVTGSHTYWSTDGVSWVTTDADPDGVTPFDGRGGMTALTFTPTGGGQRIWLLGGYQNLGQSYKDEVWSTN